MFNEACIWLHAQVNSKFSLQGTCILCIALHTFRKPIFTTGHDIRNAVTCILKDSATWIENIYWWGIFGYLQSIVDVSRPIGWLIYIVVDKYRFVCQVLLIELFPQETYSFVVSLFIAILL